MALVVTIAGTDRTSVVEFDNLTVTQVADKYTFTCEVTLFDVDSDITITAGSHKAADEITLVDGAVTYFGGFVDHIDFTCLEDGSRRQHLHCVGYGVLLGETTVEYEEYDDTEGGVTDKFIIEEIFANADYLNGVIATGATVIVLADPLVILFEEMTVDEIMTAICNRTGGRFYVDNSKVLHYFSAETADAGFDLSDEPNDVTSFDYFDRPEKARTGGNIVNKARIVGADGYTATRTDAASQAAYGIQGAIVTDSTLFCTAELNERGDDVLADQKDPRDKYVVTTTHAGAVAGDLIDFKCDDLGYNSISNGDPKLVIREMHIRWQQGDPVYQMTLGELEYSSVSKSKAVATQVKSLVLALGKAGRQSWGHSLLFSATDQNTVTWAAAGKIVSSDGNTVYTIDAGNTGNMAATTYVYLDIDNSTTALVSSTDVEVVFAKKNVILIATCHPVTAGLAEFQIMFGGHATPGGTAVHDHSDADAGAVNVRPDRIGVDAAVADLDGVIALAETFEAADPTNVAGVGMLYCKDNEGTYLYFMNDAGSITTLGQGKDDHGDLLGLADDDHAQYLLADGSRAATGAMTTRNLIPDVDSRTLGNATHTFDLYTEVVAHYGLTGNCFVVFPDNLADGLHFADLGMLADHYLTFVTANAQRELVVNQNGVDIDCRVEAVGKTRALFVRGSDGYVGLGRNPSFPLDVDGGFRIINAATHAWNYVRCAANKEAGFIFQDAAVSKWAVYKGGAYNRFIIYGYAAASAALFITAANHVTPGAAKSQDLGDATHEWDDIFYVTANVGTSRLVRSTRMCPVCGTEMVRGTGTIVIRGEHKDYALAHCLKCGNVAMEEWNHLPDMALSNRRPAPKIVLEGIRVKASGHNRQVAIDFRYGDDGMDDTGKMTNPAIRNSTRLGEYEIDEFLEMNEKDRFAFLLALGQREWDSREETRLMQEKAIILQRELDAKITSWIGKDLLRGGEIR